MLRMRRSDLANAAGISQAAIVNFESARVEPQFRSVAKIRFALEAAGVEFISENGGGAGVRLRKPIV